MAKMVQGCPLGLNEGVRVEWVCVAGVRGGSTP